MAISTASHIAEAIINLSHDKADPISNLKLQKLLYYAQAWNLALFDEALFNEPIEAWVHGPVVPSVFRCYREYRWNKINPIQNVSLTARLKKHLDEVWDVYGKFDASELERLTHSERPWRDARNGLPIDAPSHNVISHRSMKTYYSSLLK